MTPAEEITALLLELQSACKAAEKRMQKRESELREEYYARLVGDPVFTAAKRDSKRLQISLEERLADVFLPGTVVKVYDTVYSYNTTASERLATYSIGVVQQTSNDTLHILFARATNKRDFIPYSDIVELILYDELPENTPEEKKLKRRVGQLIAKVRLQEW